jgi:type IV fimbrial biogenesis protein FimT
MLVRRDMRLLRAARRLTRRQCATLHRGFTLIELTVVIAIVAILAAMAAPNLSTFIDTMDAKSAAMDLVGDLITARSEALKRNTSITVSPISGVWSNGWQITRTDQPATPLRERGALRGSLSVSAPGSVVFMPNGRLTDSEIDTGNVSWAITSTTAGVLARCVVITPTGSARAKQGACG